MRAVITLTTKKGDLQHIKNWGPVPARIINCCQDFGIQVGTSYEGTSPHSCGSTLLGLAG